MSSEVITPNWANSGSRAYDRVLPCNGDGVRYSVALPSGARFTMLKPGNAKGCEIKITIGKQRGKSE